MIFVDYVILVDNLWWYLWTMWYLWTTCDDICHGYGLYVMAVWYMWLLCDMWYICDGCVIYVCVDAINKKKCKKSKFSSYAECNDRDTRQSWEALPSAMAIALGKGREALPSALLVALGKASLPLPCAMAIALGKASQCLGHCTRHSSEICLFFAFFLFIAS